MHDKVHLIAASRFKLPIYIAQRRLNIFLQRGIAGQRHDEKINRADPGKSA
jgi:hypothetical protein